MLRSTCQSAPDAERGESFVGLAAWRSMAHGDEPFRMFGHERMTGP